MKKQASFINTIQIGGALFLALMAMIVIGVEISEKINNFSAQAEQLRTNHISNYKQIIQQEIGYISHQVQRKNQNIEKLTKQKIQDRVMEAMAVAESIYEKNKYRKSAPYIQEIIVDALRPIRFTQNKGYYFILSMDGEAVLFPSNPEMEGVNLREEGLTQRGLIAKGIIDIVSTQGHGYYHYEWTKPSQEGSNYKKIAYVQRFTPYDWIVGCGLYVDDIETQVKKEMIGEIGDIRLGLEEDSFLFLCEQKHVGDPPHEVKHLLVKNLWSKDLSTNWVLLSEIYEAARKPGGGFLHGAWVRPGNDSLSPTLTYARTIPEMGWTIGAGVYLDNVEAEIAAMKEAMTRSLKLSIIRFLGIMAVLFILLGILNYWIGKRLRINFDLFISFFNKATFSDKSIDTEALGFKEFKDMAWFANKMLLDKTLAQQGLRDERERLAVTLDSIGEGVIATNSSGAIERMNSAAEMLMGCSAKEALGVPLLSLFQVLDPMTREPVYDQSNFNLSSIVDMGMRWGHALLISRDGREYAIDHSVSIIEDEMGAATGMVIAFRDVTAEFEARQKSVELALIVEQAVEGINVSNLEGEIIYANQAWAEMHGYESGESLVGEHVSIFHSAEQMETSVEPFVQLAKSRGFNYGEVDHKRRDGTVFPTIMSSTLITDEYGEPYALAVFAQDITKRKNADKVLEENELKYRKLYENAQIGLFRTRVSDGLFLEGNQRLAEMFGFEFKQDLIGKESVADYYADPDARGRMVAQLKEKGAVRNFETPFLKRDGSLWWGRFSGFINHEEGCFEGMAAEVTEKKLAEMELKKAKSYISNIVNSMPSILIGVDQNGVITQWNNEAIRKTGKSASQAIGTPLETVMPRLSPEMPRVQEAIESGVPQTSPKAVVQEERGYRYEDIVIYPLTADGVEGAVIRIDDVTDQVRMEEMMIQSEKMLSVGGLAAGMAHEINNPLAGIMQNIQVIRNRVTRDMPVNQEAANECGVEMESIMAYAEKRELPRLFKAIVDSGERAASIVSNMLSFSRKSEGHSSFHDLPQLIDKTLDLASTDFDLKKHFDFKLITITKDYQKDLPLVQCQGAKIQQVVLNILRNGAQAMQEAGVAEPSFRVALSQQKNRNMVRIEIEDNGPGMSESVRKRVCEPFFTTKPVGVGTGLGLSVSYFIIVENHGGEMTVDSRPGAGAKFIIDLPISYSGTTG